MKDYDKMTVLIIDDYNTMIRIIRSLLKQIGFVDIDDAHDGEVGLHKMRDKKYDLVLCDWNLEGVTGLDVLNAWKREPDLRASKFISVASDSNSKAVRLSNPDACLVKPFNAATLKQRIDSVFASADPDDRTAIDAQTEAR